MEKTLVDAGIFNLPGSQGRMLTGYAGTEGHPYLPGILGAYQFNLEQFRLINYLWGREQNRPDGESRMGLLLMGPKGSGKTTLPEQYFARLGVPVASVTANRRTQVQDLIGTKTMIGGEIIHQDGPLLVAMRMGFPCIVNEIDLVDPGELTGLNDIIERGILTLDSGEVVRADRGFQFFATCNTRGCGDTEAAYAGTRIMNKALLSRMLKMYVDYQPEAVEVRILCAVFPELKIGEAELFVKAANLIRKAYQGLEAGVAPIEDTLSTRELLAWVEVAGAFRPIRQDSLQYALDVVIGNAVDPVTQRVMKELTQRVFDQAAV